MVEANVTESLTKITLNGTGKIQFHQHAEKMEFLDSNPNTFKPGLPYTAYVSSACIPRNADLFIIRSFDCDEHYALHLKYRKKETLYENT